MAFLFIVSVAALTLSTAANSKGIYQTGADFIAENFDEPRVEYKSLWLTPPLKKVAGEIMGHRIRGIRVRYWTDGDKTAWIIDEIGKELPITIGVIVKDTQIAQVKILAFRESRGWEVRYPAFTAQYQNAKITPEHKLDQHIDGITGATLSVNAVNKVATLALFYHQQAVKNNSGQDTPSDTTLTVKENEHVATQTP